LRFACNTNDLDFEHLNIYRRLKIEDQLICRVLLGARPGHPLPKEVAIIHFIYIMVVLADETVKQL